MENAELHQVVVSAVHGTIVMVLTPGFYPQCDRLINLASILSA